MSNPRTGLLGKKLGMTQIFNDRGDLLAVTVVEAGPNVVVGHRTMEKDGYTAVRLGFNEQKVVTRVNRPDLGVFSKAGVAPQKFVRELRVNEADLEKYTVGTAVPLSTVFAVNTYVDVIGTSKGKGYQGVMKRHHMPGFRATHGTHEFFRHGGSIGCRLTPGRVHRGKRMSGHMGDARTTIQNLHLLEIIEEQNVILIGGSVPGARNGYVVVKNAGKRVGPVKMKGSGEAQEKSKNPMKASKASAGAAKAKPKK